jgi:purine-binding chemotaxis protein CheW
MSKAVDYLTFSLGKFSFGIIASDVLELNKNLSVTNVPKSPETIRGIANLRGQLVPAIDMYQRLGLDNPARQQEAIAIILKIKSLLVALLVDSVGEIISLEDDTFEQPPPNFPEMSRELVFGVHKLPDRLLLLLDPTKIVQGIHSSKKPALIN